MLSSFRNENLVSVGVRLLRCRSVGHGNRVIARNRTLTAPRCESNKPSPKPTALKVRGKPNETRSDVVAACVAFEYDTRAREPLNTAKLACASFCGTKLKISTCFCKLDMPPKNVYCMHACLSYRCCERPDGMNAMLFFLIMQLPYQLGS